MENNAYRHELKYLINKREMDGCIGLLERFAGRDVHAKSGSYFIRSLYFDDMYHTAYEDKESGVMHRCKFRIRMYDMDTGFISLEKKIKEGSYIRKESARLSVGECESILKGDTAFLLGREEVAAKDFAIGCRMNGLKPEVIVDYDRVPLVFEHGGVRITFDMNIRAARGDMFDGSLCSYEVLDTDLLIMEVKFTEFLPDMFRSLLPEEGCRMAASKYVCCIDALRRIMAK